MMFGYHAVEYNSIITNFVKIPSLLWEFEGAGHRESLGTRAIYFFLSLGKKLLYEFIQGC
jgi:hypothetical protein